MRKILRAIFTLLFVAAGVISAPVAQASVLSAPTLAGTYSSGGDGLYDNIDTGTQIWASAYTPAKVYVFNKSDGALAQTISLPSGANPKAFCQNSTSVYVTNQGLSSITKIDKSTYATTQISLTGTSSDLVCNDTYVWASSYVGGKLFQISATTDSVLNTITISTPTLLATDGTSVYVVWSFGAKISKYNFTTAAAGFSGVALTMPPSATGLNDLAYGSSALWIASNSGYVMKLNPADGSTTSTTATNSSNAYKVLPYENSLLVGNGGGSTSFVYDITSGTPVYESTFAAGAKGLQFDGTYIWTVDYGQNLLKFAAAYLLAAPNAPGTPTATPGNGDALVSWSAPVGGDAPSSYTVTSSPGGLTCTVNAPATSCTVEGLTNGTEYTFTVVATNSGGDSAPSSASAGITPVDVVPGAPGTPTATPGVGQAEVSWSAPNSGGAPVSYTVTSAPGGFTCTVDAPATSCVVEGLTNGTEYTFTVVATNTGGDSAPSSASAGVTPAPDEYVVTISKTGKGSVSNSTATVDGGEVFTSTATPKKGYKFDGWVCEPDSVSTTARTLTFTVTEAVSCVATFSKKDAPVVEPSDSDIKVVFELDSWRLGNVQATALFKLVPQIKKDGYSTITITGYTDNTGSVKANRNLSLARAKAVRNFLKPYLPKVKFVVVAGGSSNPVASNATESGRAQNRRAEISFS